MFKGEGKCSRRNENVQWGVKMFMGEGKCSWGRENVDGGGVKMFIGEGKCSRERENVQKSAHILVSGGGINRTCCDLWAHSSSEHIHPPMHVHGGVKMFMRE